MPRGIKGSGKAAKQAAGDRTTTLNRVPDERPQPIKTDVSVVTGLLAAMHDYYGDGSDQKERIIREVAAALSVGENLELYAIIVPIIKDANPDDLARIFATVLTFEGLAVEERL